MRTLAAALASAVLAWSACSSLSGCTHAPKPEVVAPVVSADPVSSSDGVQGGPCGEGGACAAGLTCRTYYGVAGPQGPQFTSCEIPCVQGKSLCPAGQACLTIADGPGSVCRPQDRILPPPAANDR